MKNQRNNNRRRVANRGRNPQTNVSSLIPPSVDINPWRGLTLSAQGTLHSGQVATITTKSLAESIIFQMGLTTLANELRAKLVYRVESVRVWLGPASSGSAPAPFPGLSVRAYAIGDFAQNEQALMARKDIECYGSATLPPRANFTWPAVDRAVIITDMHTRQGVLDIRSNVDAAVHYNFRVSWKAATPTAFPNPEPNRLQPVSQFQAVINPLIDCHGPDDISWPSTDGLDEDMSCLEGHGSECTPRGYNYDFSPESPGGTSCC